MGPAPLALLAVLAAAVAMASGEPPLPSACTTAVRQSIRWGAGTSAYQIEGGWNADGKGPSIWDTLVHKPGQIADGTTGDVAVDHYNKWPQDVVLMKQLGIRHYRFSIAWTRIIPGGVKGSPVNKKGIAWYRQLIRALLDAGIKPAVTMYHWDLPQALQDAYGGFMSPRIQEDFLYYADTLFNRLGDLVTDWLTFNEVISICEQGYQHATFAPQLNAGVAAKYTCGHNLILAHAKTVKLFRERYQPKFGGRISIVLDGKWGYPRDPSNPKDVAAAEAFMVFQYAWIADPLTTGDYPQLMRDSQGPKLPEFTPAESALLRATTPDFLGINFYTGYYVSAPPSGARKGQLYDTGRPTSSPGFATNAAWLFVTPDALRKTLLWLHKRYNGIELWITENGVSGPLEEQMSLPEVLRDTRRQSYYSAYLQNVCLAKAQDGVRVTAYYAWSLLDNFEWRDGFTKRFGIVYVDIKDGQLKRHPKDSARWLSKYFFNPLQAAAVTG